MLLTYSDAEQLVKGVRTFQLAESGKSRQQTLAVGLVCHGIDVEPRWVWILIQFYPNV